MGTRHLQGVQGRCKIPTSKEYARPCTVYFQYVQVPYKVYEAWVQDTYKGHKAGAS